MPIFVRDAGVWKESEPWVRDAGVWKPVQKAWVRDAGVWKEFYSAAQPIEFIGSANNNSTSVGLPVHQPGDLIVAFATRSPTTTPPSLPSGWTNITTVSSTVGTRGVRYAYKIAQSSSETAVGFTNASRLAVAVFRNALGIGNFSTYAPATSGTTIPVSEISITAPSSYVIVAGSSNVMSTPPAGMTKTPDDTFAYGGPYATFPATSFTTSVTQPYLSAAIELLAE